MKRSPYTHIPPPSPFYFSCSLSKLSHSGNNLFVLKRALLNSDRQMHVIVPTVGEKRVSARMPGGTWILPFLDNARIHMGDAMHVTMSLHPHCPQRIESHEYKWY